MAMSDLQDISDPLSGQPSTQGPGLPRIGGAVPAPSSNQEWQADTFVPNPDTLGLQSDTSGRNPARNEEPTVRGEQNRDQTQQGSLTNPRG